MVPRKAAAKPRASKPGKGKRPAAKPRSKRQEDGGAGKHKAPKHVAIVAMGASNAAYLTMVCSYGHRHEAFDQVWAINAAAVNIEHDIAFVADDVKFELAKQAQDGRKVAAGVLRWLSEHPGDKPVFTTTAYPEWPALVEMPVPEMIAACGGVSYLNNSVAYAVAYARYIGVEELSIFGADFTYPDRHIGESGRACVEFLLGGAAAQGISINLPDTTTLLDAHVPQDRKLYGFHEPVRAAVVDGEIVLLRGQPEEGS